MDRARRTPVFYARLARLSKSAMSGILADTAYRLL
jgi:hypothetical protein